MKHSHVRSPLAKARNWGSAHDGVGHFLWQRITAIALIPLSLWFVYSILHLATGSTGTNRVELLHWLSSGFNATALILLLVALFYHAKLGIQVVIEDYVHCPALKIASLLANLFILYGMAAVSIIAVLKLHLHVFK